MTDEILTNASWTEDGIDIFTNRAKYEYITESECCSESFIVHVECPSFGGVILSKRLESILIDPWPGIYHSYDYEDDGNCQEEVSQYFYKLMTTKGELLIEMRNYSNGYYGGELILI